MKREFMQSHARLIERAERYIIKNIKEGETYTFYNPADNDDEKISYLPMVSEDHGRYAVINAYKVDGDVYLTGIDIGNHSLADFDLSDLPFGIEYCHLADLLSEKL